MQSSMIFHTDAHYLPALLDQYQTRTGDETALVTPSSAPTLPTDQCAECNAKGRLITAEKAAAICQCSRRTIYRWIEEGALHFRELPDGVVLVCGATLTAKLEQLEGATSALPH